MIEKQTKHICKNQWKYQYLSEGEVRGERTQKILDIIYEHSLKENEIIKTFMTSVLKIHIKNVCSTEKLT